MRRSASILSRFALLLALPAGLAAAAAQAAPPRAPERLGTDVARSVAARALDLVDSRALPAGDRKAQDRARQALAAYLAQPGDSVERAALLARIQAVLATIDDGNHSYVFAPQATQRMQQVMPQASVHRASLRIEETSAGAVLHWTPPQTMRTEPDTVVRFMRDFLQEARDHAGLERACALVVDLGAQRGGNAWPPLTAMMPLLGPGNTAAFVDRQGSRTALVSPSHLAKELREQQRVGTPLLRFAGQPVAVVLDRTTSSAGEMLAIALLGEGERIRTFGYTTDGRTSANMTHVLPDGSLLVLTERRYAVGATPVRGGIAPQEPAREGEDRGALVRRAAEWAAGRSPLCRPATQPGPAQAARAT